MKYLFFSDAAVFGGHERVCLDVAEALSLYGEIVFAVSALNRVMVRSIEEKNEWARVIETDAVHKRGALYAAPFRLADQRSLETIISSENPDVIFLCQGRIETCAPQMFLLARANIPYVSILPFAHAVGEIKSHSWTRRWEDSLRGLYYRSPSAFIVPSAVGKAQLTQRGAIAPIHVLPNILQTAPSGRSTTITNILRCVGRIEFAQKRQDRLVELIARSPSSFSKYRIQFVGDGPDMTRLQKMIADLRLDTIVEAIGVLPRDQVLAEAAAVIMPSRFEGVPLTMLEALSEGVPVIGSDIDIFRSYLPAFAVDPFDDWQRLLQTIEVSLDHRNLGAWAALRKKILHDHAEERLADAVKTMITTGLPLISKRPMV